MLHVHRAERADRLADGLAEVLRDGLGDPFAVEVVAVPARGVERWLTQRLSHRLGAGSGGTDGVCANIRFPSPGQLVNGAVATGGATDPADDPWQPGRIVWPLLEIVTESAAESEVPTLVRRFSSAQHLAGLYEAYGAQRPELIRSWAAGADVDGAGGALDADQRWQAELWRRLRARIGAPSPAERLAAACSVLRERPDVIDLPARLSLFGATRLTSDQLAVLAALAERRDVHLWLPHPSPALWERVATGAASEYPIRRRADPTATLVRHPLLASLGRDARELQLLLAGVRVQTADHHDPDLAGVGRETLLTRIQRELRDDQPPTSRYVLDPQDRSVQVHACHGPARQVEVLREVLLGLLEADPTLEPRDILVMCPDIEAFAPLITAAFGAGEDGGGQHPGQQLRVRLADRSLRQTNPLLAIVARLLELADARVTASQVLDLAASPPVRRRFALDDEDSERIRDWVSRAGIRWGLDAAHRAPYRLSTLGQNTWQAGLDRILLGAAMSEDDDRWLGLALPLDDVDSGDIDLAGRLAELLDRLGTALDELTGERTLAEWLGSLGTGLEALTAVSDRDSWQLAQARRELTEVAEEAGDRAHQVLLTLPDVRALLAGRLRGRPTRANFRTGSLTMCTMVPMRSVPHRVICLLGLDDGTFPRNAVLDGDDVLAREPLVGERDRRSEERQLLLDAVLAATEQLVVLYSGADERTNALRLPAVPIGEILDALDATACTADGRPARAQVVLRHPLQPFDARNFTADTLGTAGPFSFDRPSLAGARAAVRPRAEPPPFLADPFDVTTAGPVALEDLLRFLEHPVRAFLRQRLDVTVPGEDEEVADGLSAELSHLERWAVGDRLLKARLAGADAERSRQAEWRRGTLPPGALGRKLLDSLMGEVEPLVSAAAAVRTGEPCTLDVTVSLPGGAELSGTVPHGYGQTLVRVAYSRLAAKHRVRAWGQLLALAASRPEQTWQALTIGRGYRCVARSTLLAPPAEQAREQLADLLDLYGRGMREPLPLVTKASPAYATQRAAGAPEEAALAAAADAWRSNGGMGDADDRYHQLVWGAQPEFAVLLASAPRGDETGLPGEPSRFGVLARRLWDPLLAAETTDSP